MEVILDCFFEKFAQLERNTLHARYKRREMVEYFNTIIEGCSRGEQCDSQKTCREAILYVIRYHEKSMAANGTVCVMGKFHNVLYVGVKICYDWQLKDCALVSALLDQIYFCEKSFDRIWVGALFGIRAPFFVAGWKSDFDDQEENTRAVVYFLDRTNNANAEYLDENGDLCRFVDLPLETCGKATPLKIYAQLGFPDKLHILLRFGAKCDSTVIESLLDNLNSFKRCYPYNLVDCLQFCLRAIPSISLPQDESDIIIPIMEKYPDLIEDGIIPITRCGIIPPELKHLCRCLIRESLWKNHQLPNGVKTLNVPIKLQRYLDLMLD